MAPIGTLYIWYCGVVSCHRTYHIDIRHQTSDIHWYRYSAGSPFLATKHCCRSPGFHLLCFGILSSQLSCEHIDSGPSRDTPFSRMASAVLPGIAEIKEGVDRWDPTITVQDLFGPNVKGRVLLESLWDLYQVTCHIIGWFRFHSVTPAILIE